MNIPELIPVESKRFAFWAYVASSSRLFVRFHPSKGFPVGRLYYYDSVAPEQWDEAQEESSKGAWLIREIINRPSRHPFYPVDEPEASLVALGMAKDGIVFVGLDGHPLPAERKTDPAPESATLADMQLVPAAVREVQPVPSLAIVKLPEILPPDVSEGNKPFTQMMRERAAAIAAAIPMVISISDESGFKAFGAAKVVLQKERKGLEDALGLLARPLIDMKRQLDDFRNAVLDAYTDSEKRLDNALHLYRRQVEATARADSERIRKENEQRAIDAEKTRRRVEADRVAEDAKRRKEEADRIIADAEAQTTSESRSSLLGDLEPSIAASVIEDAKQVIVEAEAEVAQAMTLADAPIHRTEVYTPPVATAVPDLKVHGMRRRSAKWIWEFLPQSLKGQVDQTGPIGRGHLKDPNSIPDEYWILDKKSIDALVDRMKDRVNIQGIKAYDKNA